MKRIIFGIDEVGRGALAGPVVLAAVIPRRRISWTHREFGRIRDSKKLTPLRREAWFRHLTAHPALDWRVARVSPAVIDRINISKAANLAAYRLVQRVMPSRRSATSKARPRRSVFVWLDGGLALPEHVLHKALIRGDERVPLIAAASIIAKVWRDRIMRRLAVTLPAYGFEIHKGYATRHHRRMLRQHGLSAVHRRSFCRRLI